MKKPAILVACLAVFATCANAAPTIADDPYAGLVSFSFQLLKDGAVIQNAITVSGPDNGVAQVGRTVGHARLSCGTGQRILEAVLLFDGIKVEHRVQGAEVVVDLTKFDVMDKDEEIKALQPGQCRDLAPVQQVVLQKTLRLPVTPAEATVLPLEKGYALRYQVLPAIVGRIN